MIEESKSFSDLVLDYTKIKESIDALKAQHKKELAEYNEEFVILEAKLLNELNNQGVNSIKTDYGSVDRSINTRLSISDSTKYFEWVFKNKAVELLYKRVNSAGYKEHIDEYIENYKDTQPEKLELFRSELFKRLIARGVPEKQHKYIVEKRIEEKLLEKARHNVIPGINYSLEYKIKFRKNRD